MEHTRRTGVWIYTEEECDREYRWRFTAVCVSITVHRRQLLSHSEVWRSASSFDPQSPEISGLCSGTTVRKNMKCSAQSMEAEKGQSREGITEPRITLWVSMRTSFQYRLILSNKETCFTVFDLNYVYKTQHFRSMKKLGQTFVLFNSSVFTSSLYFVKCQSTLA